MSKANFYICEHCGNIIEKIVDKGAPIVCCGQKMTKIEAGTVDASREKHIPKVELDGDTVKVTVGSVVHPMSAEHYIEWIYLETEKGIQRKHLTPDDAPTAIFKIADDKPVAVFAYCNLHGLWKAEI